MKIRYFLVRVFFFWGTSIKIFISIKFVSSQNVYFFDIIIMIVSCLGRYHIVLCNVGHNDELSKIECDNVGDARNGWGFGCDRKFEV